MSDQSVALLGQLGSLYLRLGVRLRRGCYTILSSWVAKYDGSMIGIWGRKTAVQLIHRF